jgi:hypothetical protein
MTPSTQEHPVVKAGASIPAPPEGVDRAWLGWDQGAVITFPR